MLGAELHLSCFKVRSLLYGRMSSLGREGGTRRLAEGLGGRCHDASRRPLYFSATCIRRIVLPAMCCSCCRYRFSAVWILRSMPRQLEFHMAAGHVHACIATWMFGLVVAGEMVW